MSARLDHLREHLAENKLLGEVLAPHHNPVGSPAAATNCQKPQEAHETADDPCRSSSWKTLCQSALSIIAS
jgi:hypothetical protein